MGLDIYAGTLTRYYSHNWKTVVQQWAEENGYSFNRITPDGEPADNEEEMSPAEVQAAVENWRDQILSAISQPGQPPYAPWLEDNEKPYYTDKPDWDAFGAMLLVAACPYTYEDRSSPPWRRTGSSGSILWSPALHQMRSGCGPCFVGLPGGSLFLTAFCSKGPCLPMTPPLSPPWADCGRSWKS